jgi:8-oxo-dGTP diphosphatase
MAKNNKIVKVGVGVLVMDKENRMLLGKRKNSHGENTYHLPGGHLEFGESFEECAKRELKEETNLDGDDFQIVSLSNKINYDKHYVTIGLLIKSYNGGVKLMEPDKCEGWKWYDKNDLPKPLFEPSKKIIENYFKGNIYKP